MELIALAFVGLFVWLTMAAASLAMSLAFGLIALIVYAAGHFDMTGMQPPKRFEPVFGSRMFATLSPALPEIAIVAFAVSLGAWSVLPSL